MRAKVTRRGDELVIVIPQDVARQEGVAEGAEVDVKKHRITLEELVAGITDENRHEETDWGPPVGNEVW